MMMKGGVSSFGGLMLAKHEENFIKKKKQPKPEKEQGKRNRNITEWHNKISTTGNTTSIVKWGSI